MSAELEEHDERLKDRLLQVELALRNLLASIGGLFIGAASLLAVIDPKIPRLWFVAVILLCSIVLFCTLLDFRFYRHGYQSIAFTPRDALRDPAKSDAYIQQLEASKQCAAKQKRWKKKREKLCYLCLAATILIFLIAIWRY
jgi:hypothetical protein